VPKIIPLPTAATIFFGVPLSELILTDAETAAIAAAAPPRETGRVVCCDPVY
jgi:hypothetical protein